MAGCDGMEAPGLRIGRVWAGVTPVPALTLVFGFGIAGCGTARVRPWPALCSSSSLPLSAIYKSSRPAPALLADLPASRLCSVRACRQQLPPLPRAAPTLPLPTPPCPARLPRSQNPQGSSIPVRPPTPSRRHRRRSLLPPACGACRMRRSAPLP